MDKETFRKINELGKFINYPLIKENDGTHQYWMYNHSSGSVLMHDDYDKHLNIDLANICRYASNSIAYNKRVFIKELLKTKERDNYLICIEILYKLTIKDRKIYDNSKKLNKNLNHLYKKKLKYGFR